MKAGLDRVSGLRAVDGGPLEFTAASVDLRMAIDGLKKWLSQHATEAQLLTYGDLGLAARMLDHVGHVHSHIRQLESATRTLSQNVVLSERQAAYSRFETAGRALITYLRQLEKDLM